MFITKIALCWWTLHIFQYLYISFVLPYCGCQVAPHPSLYVTLLLFHFLSKSNQHPLSVWSNSPTAVCSGL